MPEFVNPDGWAKPKGYNNGVILEGSRSLFVAGQVAWDEKCQMVGEGDFAVQFKQVLGNIRAIVEKAGGSVENIGRLTIYVKDKNAYMKAIKQVGENYREVFGKHYPAMALVQVADLLEEGALLEIEAQAVLK